MLRTSLKQIFSVFALLMVSGILLSYSANADVDIVPVGNGNSSCLGTLISTQFLGIEDAPLTNPNVNEGYAPASYEEVTPFPDGFESDPYNFCFQYEVRETGPGGNEEPGGYYVPYQRFYGMWFSGPSVGVFYPTYGSASGGYVTQHAKGRTATTFEPAGEPSPGTGTGGGDEWCTTSYVPQQCTTSQQYVDYGNYGCSGGSVISVWEWTDDYFTGDTSGEAPPGGICQSQGATCCRWQANTTWQGGEPRYYTQNYATYSGSTSIAPSSWPEAYATLLTSSQSCTGGYNTTSCVPASNDLTAGTPTLASGALVSSNTLTFASTITNLGSTPTSAFGVRFEVDLNNNGSYDTPLDNANAFPSGLSNGASSALTSSNWIASVGTHGIRACADYTGAVNETNENNNCSGTYTFTIADLPVCSDGADNEGDGATDYPADSDCASASGTSEGSPPPPPTYECSDGIDNDGINGADYPDDPGCASESDNNESTPPPTLTLIANNRVRPQERATVTWSATSVTDGSCTVLGDNTPPNQWAGESGSQLSSPLTNETRFTLRCTDLASHATSTTRTVRIAPSSGEE